MEATTGKITLDWLLSKGACRDQIDIFRAEWGESATVNPGNLQKAIDLGLDLNWFAMHFLNRQEWLGYYRTIEPLLADHDRATESLRADYYRARKSLRADYDRSIESLRADYRRATEPLWADYRRATEPLWADYDRAIESLWADYRWATESLWVDYKRAIGAVLGKVLFGHDA